jgi:phosphatidylserine/phosphatidylglycerophosphate/cardiolipin synthase-like enzyme
MTSTALWRGVGTCLLAAASMGALVPGTGVDLSLATAKPKTSAPGLVAVLVEPSKLGSATGMQPVYAFVLSAKKSVDMTMYELSDPIMVNDLVADRRRGVKVRVVLDTNRERSRNLRTFQALGAGGVKAVWADTAYEATHQKTITVDRAKSLVLSANLTSEYYTTTRDFGVVDTSAADVAAIEAVFNADFAHRTIVPSDGADLVWSPGSQAQMLAVINGARHTLSIENEEMASSAITGAIVAAAERGVKLDITMTADSYYDSDLDEIVRAGGHVHLYANESRDLYIHAKTTIADAGTSTRRAYVGSINFSSASMDRNRELGVITSDPKVVSELNAVVTGDYSNCRVSTGCRNYS